MADKDDKDDKESGVRDKIGAYKRTLGKQNKIEGQSRRLGLETTETHDMPYEGLSGGSSEVNQLLVSIPEHSRFAHPTEQYREKYARWEKDRVQLAQWKKDSAPFDPKIHAIGATGTDVTRMRDAYIQSQGTMASELPAFQAAHNKVESELKRLDEISVRRAQDAARTQLILATRPDRLRAEATTRRQTDPSIQSAGLAYAQEPSEALAARKRDLELQLRSIGKETLDESNIYKKDINLGPIEIDPSKMGVINEASKRQANLTSEYAKISAAEAIQKTRGEDPQSRMQSLLRTEQRVNTIIGTTDIAKQIQETKGVHIKSTTVGQGFGEAQTIGIKDISTEFATQTNIFREAMIGLKKAAEELQQAFGETKDEAQLMHDNFEAVAHTAKENMQTLETSKRIVGDDGGSQRYRTASQVASALAGGFGAIGGAVEAVMVTQRLGQLQNVSGLASIENEKYSMYQRARQGDVQSMMLLPQWQKAEEFGAELHTGQQAANYAYLTGGIAQTAAGGIQTAEGLIQKNPFSQAGAVVTGNMGSSTNEIIQGGLNLTVGAATSVTTGMDIRRDVSAGAAGIQGTSTNMAARRTLSEIPAAQIQQFRNLAVGLGTTAMGMGTQGEGFLGRTVNQNLTPTNTMESAIGSAVPRTKSFMEKMMDARMSPEQYVAAAQLGQQQMGNVFNENVPLTAKNLQYAGLGTQEENMQRSAILAQAGGNNPQTNLAAVLEVAVNKGVTSSTAMTKLVENTAVAAQGSFGRALGLDTTQAAATIAGATINQAAGGDIYAVNRAQTVAQRMADIRGEQGFSFVTSSTMNRTMSNTGIGYQEASLIPKIDIETIKAFEIAVNDSNPEIAKAGVGKMRAAGFTDKIPGKDEPGAVDTARKFIKGLIKTDTQTKLMGGSEAAGYTIPYAAEIGQIGAELIATDPTNINKKISEYEQEIETDKFKSPEHERGLKALARSATSQKMSLNDIMKGATAGLISDLPNDPNSTVGKGILGTTPESTTTKVFEMADSGFKQLSESALEATKKFGSAAETLKTLSAAAKAYEEGALEREKRAGTAAEEVSGGMDLNAKKFDASITKFDYSIDKLVAQLAGKPPPSPPETSSTSTTKR